MPTVETTEERFHPVTEACNRLGGISRSYFYELVRTGQLRAQKLGSRTVVSQSEIARFVQAQPAVDLDGD